MTWFVYIVRCSDNTLYTGVTTNISRRVREHNSKGAGAKYTKTKRPVTLVYQESVSTRSDALKREAYIKNLPKKHKENLTKTRKL